MIKLFLIGVFFLLHLLISTGGFLNSPFAETSMPFSYWLGGFCFTTIFPCLIVFIIFQIFKRFRTKKARLSILLYSLMFFMVLPLTQIANQKPITFTKMEISILRPSPHKIHPKTIELSHQGQIVHAYKEHVISIMNIKNSYFSETSKDEYSIIIDLNEAGKKQLHDYTSNYLGESIYLVADGVVFARPTITSVISQGSFEISSQIDMQTAYNISRSLKELSRNSSKSY